MPPFPAAFGEPERASLYDKHYDMLLLRDSPFFEQIMWVPIGDVRSGRALVKQYRERLLSRTPFGCQGVECIAIVPLLVEPNAGIDEAWGACRVQRIGGVVGAPEVGEGIYARAGTEIWLKAALITDIPRAEKVSRISTLRVLGPEKGSLDFAREQLIAAL